MGGVTDSMITSDFHVEAPRLPGHGTTIDDMLTTGWSDWTAEVTQAYSSLSQRVDRMVVVGQSMGATLALWAALEHPQIAGLVCINPATRTRDADTMAMIDDFIEDGVVVVPGEGSDIADPEAHDISYDGTPLQPLRSLVYDGISKITDRFGELTMPLRLFTSRQDHVVEPADSDYLAAAYGGSVEHSWLERSFHVATRDYDRDYLNAETSAFVARVAR